ncbi:MAG: 2-hydroxyglutaryl-CoA dehydratase [bacterium]|nr:MAG: 2-hydroxyglutaryl-CoA dehydratase [bacterium]
MKKTLGIDVGSRCVKLVGFDEGKLLFTEKLDTIRFYRRCRTGSGGIDIAATIFRSRTFDFDRIVSTGYGRHSVKIDGAEVTSEIRAHALGAVFQTGLSDFTLVDIGGQDTKIVKIRRKEVDDFVMNDKCAAGSGRYLENISRSLDISVEEIATYSAEPVKLSITCAIFGESEVIGYLAEGTPLERICAGANLSVAQRILSLIRRYDSSVYVITGGVAKNRAVVGFIRERCGGEVLVPEHPIHNGAMGCCLHAGAETPNNKKSCVDISN